MTARDAWLALALQVGGVLLLAYGWRRIRADRRQ